MRNSNVLTVLGRFWIIGFLISLPIGIPAIITGAISLGFLAFVALLVALVYNGIQWAGHKLLFGHTQEYQEFKAHGLDPWFDHSCPWPFRPDNELLTPSQEEPTTIWRCGNCHAEMVNLDAPCWNCDVEWLCPKCNAPVADEFAACGRCGNDPLSK